MKTDSIISFYPCGKCFIPNDGKLNESEIKKVIIDINSGNVKYEVNLCNEDRVVNLDIDIFATEADYKNNNSINTVDWSAKDVAYKISEYCECVNYNEQAVFYGWIFKAPSPRRERIFPKTITIDGRQTTVTGEGMPERIYQNYQDALNYNEAIVKMQDGTEKVVRGAKLRLALTNEQKALIEELRNKLRECKDAGIQFIYNSDEWTFGAFNKTECDNFQSDWNSDNRSSDEYYIEMGEEPENLGEIFPTSLYVNCEAKIYIKFKD